MMRKGSLARDSGLWVRVSQADKARIEALAQAYGLSISELVRSAALELPVPSQCRDCQDRKSIVHSAITLLHRAG
jgi:hypothetical protein